ncbi:MAG: hypothetical protein HFJ34_00355 [Clostridia bacterium]|nr:hypothetical protein [Clostridia bacterium]
MKEKELREIFDQLIEQNNRGELCGVGIVISSNTGKSKHIPPKFNIITLGDISQQQIIGMARKDEQRELLEMSERLKGLMKQQ